MHEPIKRDIIFVLNIYLKKQYINILYRRDGSTKIYKKKKIDNLGEQQLHKLSKLISKSRKQLAKEESKKKLD